MDISEPGSLSLQEPLLHRYKRDILHPVRSSIIEGGTLLFRTVTDIAQHLEIETVQPPLSSYGTYSNPKARAPRRISEGFTNTTVQVIHTKRV